MRITNGTMNRTFLNNVNKSMRRMLRAQQRATTGKSVSRPSDDPLLVGKILAMRDNIEQNEQYNSNISDAIGWTKTQDTALNDISGTLNRVRDLIIYGSNGTLSDTDRNAIREEVSTSLGELKDILNTNYDGRYVFAGQKTSQPPFGDNLEYSGDGGDVLREIAQGVVVGLKTQGDDATRTIVEKERIGADGKPEMVKVEQELGDFLNEILDAMDSTKANPGYGTGYNPAQDPGNDDYKPNFDPSALGYNAAQDPSRPDVYNPNFDPDAPGYNPVQDPSRPDVYNPDYKADTPERINKTTEEVAADSKKLSTELLGSADKFIENVLGFRSQVGAIHNRLESSEERNKTENINLKEVLSEKEDVDLAESYMEYIMMTTGYQASLSMGAKILQPSLLDYLR